VWHATSGLWRQSGSGRHPTHEAASSWMKTKKFAVAVRQSCLLTSSLVSLTSW